MLLFNDLQAIATVDAATAFSRRLDDYYNGVARLHQMGLALPPELHDLQTVINWPRLIVDSLEERLDVEGFRMTGHDQGDDRLWSWWQANRLDEESSLGHIEAFVQGSAAVFVGANEDDPTVPIITVESLNGVRVFIDQRTGKVEWAVRIYEHDDNGSPVRAAVYRVGYTRYYVALNGQGWKLESEVFHDLPIVPVVPLVNRSRLGDRTGRSEMHDVIPITDAACRTLTNLQGAQEMLAVPQRYVLGADESDFVDAEGNKKTTWEAYLGRFLALGNPDAKIGQLADADLRNFTEVINHYARLVSALSGLPPHFLGLATDNPPSADAIRSSEARLVKRAERRARAFEESWEQVMRLSLLVVDGKLPDGAHRMETIWRDPATPTEAAKVDAVVKLFSARDAQGRSILPREMAWEALGYSVEKQRRIQALDDDDPAVRFLAQENALTPAAPADDA